jgi:hypothetical protein
VNIIRDYSALEGRVAPPANELASGPSRLRATVPAIFVSLVPPVAVLSALQVGATEVIVLFVLLAACYFVIAVSALTARRPQRHSAAFVEDAALARFAHANDLEYTAVNPLPRYPGVLFALPRHGANVVDRLRTRAGRYIEIGNLDFSDINGQEDSWGFIAIHLDQRLPHLVLAADRASRQLPFDLVEAQRLRLEGDFDRHFTLFAPSSFERDALYIFAPDLMVLFIDEIDDMHAEIIDDWFFVYSSTDFRGADALRMQQLFRIVDVVGAKMQRQSRQYTGVANRPRRSDRGANVLRWRKPDPQRSTSYLPFVGIAIALALVWTQFAG